MSSLDWTNRDCGPPTNVRSACPWFSGENAEGVAQFVVGEIVFAQYVDIFPGHGRLLFHGLDQGLPGGGGLCGLKFAGESEVVPDHDAGLDMPLQTRCSLVIPQMLKNISKTLDDRPLKARCQYIELDQVNMDGKLNMANSVPDADL